MIGDYEAQGLIHEIGHALGLEHGHENSDYGALPFSEDSMEFSVMTYRSYIGSDAAFSYNEDFGFPQTYMMSDIAALQKMYGADFTTNGGDTVYKWNPNSGDTLVNGQVALDASTNKIFATIWDGGGTDTYDLSAYTNGLTLDLGAGGHSQFSTTQTAGLGAGNFARGNIFNALLYNGSTASLIENAIGGSGGDTINGNQADNTITGNGGNDTINALSGDDTVYDGSGNDNVDLGSGNDTVIAGTGTDTFVGGTGTDHISYENSAGGVTLNLANNTVSGGEGTGDSISGFENASGSSVAADTIYGSSADNIIKSLGGADWVFAGSGVDQVYGGDGNDTLIW